MWFNIFRANVAIWFEVNKITLMRYFNPYLANAQFP